MSIFLKNIEKLLIFFFTAISIVLVMMGISRVKKTMTTPNTPTPSTQGNGGFDTQGAVTFTGTGYQTPWGAAIASIAVKNGKIVAVNMPSVPNSPPSIYAEPYLIDQALSAGGSNIQGVSGATYTSIAFKSSLESAIANAENQGQSITQNTTVSPTTKPSVPRKYRDDDDD